MFQCHCILHKASHQAGILNHFTLRPQGIEPAPVWRCSDGVAPRGGCGNLSPAGAGDIGNGAQVAETRSPGPF